MIGGVRGRVVARNGNTISLETKAGITFEIKIPSSSALNEGDEIYLHVYTVFNQQSGFTLYGFEEVEQREVFKTLLEVPGIGPSVALQILSELSLKDLSVAVRTGNVSLLKRVRGLGTKKAEMVVFALKDAPLPEIEGETAISEAIKALVALGMEDDRARELVSRGVDEGLKNVEELVSYALKHYRQDITPSR